MNEFINKNSKKKESQIIPGAYFCTYQSKKKKYMYLVPKYGFMPQNSLSQLFFLKTQVTLYVSSSQK